MSTSKTKRKAPDSDDNPQSTTPSTTLKKSKSITSFFTPTAPPTSSSSSTPAATSSFNKEKWLSKLTDDQKSLLELEINTMHDSWLSVLKDDLVTNEFLGLKRFLRAEKEAGKKVYPPEGDVYSWSRYTPVSAVKVVILGQDPYHGANQAHGLSFSVRPPTRAPPSLKNMYIALKKDYPDFTPPAENLGLLTPWAERGVLLLNACLTVRASEPNSHASKGWERLTQKVIDVIAARKGVVFLAWGKPAEKRVAKIDRRKHAVLLSVHPSPLSASRGFFDCGHFRKANEWLVERYGEGAEIDWSLKPVVQVVRAVEKGPAAKKKKVEEKEKEKEEEEDVDGERELLERDNREISRVKKKTRARDSLGEVFDEDEEAAMIEATLAAEGALES